MANETARLAEYAAQLSFEAIPRAVLRRAKDCLIDTVAIGYRGSRVPWIDVLRRYADGDTPGRAAVFGDAAAPQRAETAALLNGTMVHGLEMDSLRKPGVGVHLGATIVPAVLALGQERGLDGRTMLTSIVAGCEVLVRIGRATRHTVEDRGLHAPSVTGPLGATAAVGRLLDFDARRMESALGIAGSMSSGLMQFAAADGGALVKRLHLGRAAAAGVSATRWAEAGMAGPEAVLEGKYGVLNAFCQEADPGALVDGLGATFETLTICFKRYACHITAQTAVYAVEQLQGEHGFTPAQVDRVVVRGSDRMVRTNAQQHPGDPVKASYSIPFCLAVALYGRQFEPESFGAASLEDAGMGAVRRRITVLKREGSGGHFDWSTEVEIQLKDGTSLRRLQTDFPGTPTTPLERHELAERFRRLVDPVCGEKGSAELLARLETIETEPRLDWIGPLPVRS